MSFTRNKTADANTSSTVKAAKRAQKASSAAAANAASAAQNAALTAQNAAGVAQVVAQNAATAATNAAQTASGATQTAAAGVSKGVKQGVYNARSWAAPRIDTAADYCATTVAPKVSTALHNTARQVRPVEATKSRRSSILIWSVLGAAVLAALGAAAAMARYRYRAEIAAESEDADEEVLPDPAGGQAAPASPDGTRPASEKPKGQDTETPANGRVTASGW
jgi:hypothetical protein